MLMVVIMLLLGCGLAAATTAWWVKRNIYASPMRPVRLDNAEQIHLNDKLAALQHGTASPRARTATPAEQSRTLNLTQREINAYLAEQNLGENIRIDLGEGTINATVILPVPKDSGLPLVSGTTLRLTMTVDAAMDSDHQLAIKLSDVRVGGLSMPNAWVGQLKGVNLMADNVRNDPALQSFLAGIKELEIHPEGLRVLLND